MPSAVTMTEVAHASDVAQRHAGWIVWTQKPCATRALHTRPDPHDGVFSQTLICDTWSALEAELTAQDANDAYWGRKAS